jgi:hypothetical protein
VIPKNTDQQVAHLLREAAETIPQDTNLLPRLQRHLVAATTKSGGSPHSITQLHTIPRWGYLAVSGLLIAGLLLSAFTFARPLILSWFGDQGLKGLSLQNATLVNRTVTAQGLTVRLEQVYADAARTVLTMQISSSGANQATPRLDTTYLADSQGRKYPLLTSSQVQGDGLYEFVPLPNEALNAQQTLTLVVQEMLPGSAAPPVAGPWQITFHVQPHNGRSIPLALTPQIHNDVAIQPERLDLAPAGIRLAVRISGLKADTSLAALANFTEQSGDIIVGCPPGSDSCVSTSSTGNGALLQLRGPDGTVLMPNWVVVQDESSQGVGSIPGAGQVVGANGTVVLEFLFSQPFHATQGTVHLAIDQLHLASGSASSQAPEQIVSGPWTFSLPLSA